MRRTLVLLLLVACSKESKEPPKQSPKDSAPATEGFAPSGDKPAHARRPGPIANMLDGAVAVGAKAPPIALSGFELGDALTRTERVLLVFYRGDW